MRKVTVPEKFIRLAIVGALCVNVYGCGVSTGRDLTLAGAVQRFDDRRAAVRAEQAVLEGVDTKRAAQLKPLPPRRELLQVRVPALIEVDDIADDVVAASITDMTGLGVDLSVGSRGNGQLLSGKRSLESQIKALDKRSETIRRQRRSVLSKYNMEKLLLDQMDMRHSKSRDLTLQGFKIANEKMLQGFIADLEQQYAEAEPTTIIGLTDNSELGALALFGRNELARKDEYVSLEKSFLFVGNDVNTGVSLGRMDDLSDEVGSRTLSVNLAGLRLPTALKSLARSINMQVYLSPAVNAAPQKVSLDISRADALDIFDILIDNYGLAMAYDRKMGVARFYTRAEFSERVDDAVAAAELHNRRARNLRKISSLENDTAALRQIYQNYFQHPDDAGRVRSLTNDAIIEDDHSPAVAGAIVAFKETALQNERDLDALDLEHATDRQEQATKTQTAQFELEDVDKALALLASERAAKQQLLDDVMVRLAADTASKTVAGVSADTADSVAEAPRNTMQQPDFADVPNAEELRGRVVRDANLKTTEPIFTEKFTIFNSEGAASCDGDSGDRVTEIQTELTNYFEQLYPEEMIAAEKAAEERTEAERIARENAAREAEERAQKAAEEGLPLFDPLQEALVSSNVTDIATDLVPAAEPAETVARQNTAAATQAADNAQTAAAPTANGDAPSEVENPVTPIFLTDSSFRRPTVTAVGDTVIITGFRHDIELVSELMESFDKPDKQVLVEVFMVNVAKNWQRQLQSKLENAVRTAAKTDPDIGALPDTVKSQLPNLVEVRDNSLIGIGGALNFANRAAAANTFTLNNFRLGLAWTIDFMESNSLGRKVSSPTILALDGCEAQIEKSETRYLPITSTSAPVVTPGGQTVPGEETTTYEPREATLSLTVTPTINPLNDHVRLKIAFNDDFFLTADANSDKIQSKINTEFIAAPGDVIVLAGLYTEDNSKSRNGLPGMTGIPIFGSFLGTSSDAKSSQEMVIFLAPEVITPKAGEMPVNSARYYDVN
ncbi:MAG: type II secretion system protein GspD [Parvibaculales bacterium]